MKITDRISQFRDRFFRRWETVKTIVFGWDGISCHPFGETIFRNIVELLTDLTNDVEWVNQRRTGNLRFAEFKVFFERDGQLALWRVYKKGFAVVGVKDGDSPRFRLFDENEYRKERATNNTERYVSKVDGWKCYVMQSETFREEGKSDYDLCKPFVTFLDNVFNASNTSTERLGTFIVASPETPTGYPTPVTLDPKQKKELEEEVEKQYGALRKQRQMMILPRGMKFQVIGMDGVDRKLTEKVRTCVLAICDRVKVPANQVAIIDANSSKTFSNGTELREGDYNKYQSFERLLNHTFVRLAEEMGMDLTYTIYNKPQRINGNQAAE